MGFCEHHYNVETWDVPVDAAYVVTLNYGFLGHLSKGVSQMEASLMAILHLCQPQIQSLKNSQS